MTPKEKADELVKKYMQTKCCILTKFDSIPEIICDQMTFQTAKQCALIAIGELLILASFYDKKVWDYLEEVKQEVEKL
jgi:hypothetical protein